MLSGEQVLEAVLLFHRGRIKHALKITPIGFIACTKPLQEKDSESGALTPSYKEQIWGVENNGNEFSIGIMDKLKFDEINNSRNSELIITSGNMSNTGVVMDVVTSVQKQRGLVLNMVCQQHQGKTRGSIAFDISFDVENGPKAAEYIHNAISEWSPLRPWCLTLKILL